MAQQKGVFIVLEGGDGSGKSTQFRLLAERLKAVGYEVEVFDFPRYEHNSSHFIKAYLNGDYGPADRVSPYTASLFYALDRYEAAPAIREALAQGKVVLSDRYVGSNMAHQGSKISDPVNQRGFFLWEDSLEYQLLAIPRPNISLFLRVSAEVSNKLIAKRNEKRHEHENDIEHMRRAVATFDTLCKLFPKDFIPISSARDNKLLPITEINDRIWRAIKPILPPRPPNKARSVTVSLENLSPQTTPISKSSAGKDNTAAPLTSGHIRTIELKRVSLLVANYIIFIDGLDTEASQVSWPKKTDAYYISSGLPPKVAKSYREGMKKLGESYQTVERQLRQNTGNNFSRSALNNLLPLSVLCDIKISGSDSQLSELALKMAAATEPELVWSAHQIDAALTRKAHNKNPALQLPKSHSFAAEDSLVKLARENLPGNIAAEPEKVSLLSAWPRNELDLLVDSLYAYSDLSREAIAKSLEYWKYDDKKKALVESIQRRGALILENVHYKLDIVATANQLHELFRLMSVEGLHFQSPTPRYGYDVPEVIESVTADDSYLESFDASLKLFSDLQAAGQNAVAPYATLRGHRLRCEFSISGKSLMTALKSKEERPAELLADIVEKIAEVHPLIVETLKKSGENPRTIKTPGRRTRRSAANRKKK